jgi:hypothetical protein
MAEVVTVTAYLSVGAGASGRVTVFTVPPARVFRLRTVRLHCSSGTDLRLRCRVMYGDKQVLPYSGWLRAEPGVSQAEGEFVYGGESRVDVEYVNEDTGEAHSFYITLTGELE